MFSFKQIVVSAFLGVVVLGPAALAQKFEVGAGGGASLYNAKSVAGGSGTIEAKLKPGYGFSGFVGQIGDRVGGELRYSWFSNEMQLSSGGTSFTMGGRTQSFGYNILYYFANRKAKVRPYVLGGGGVKQYSGTGSSVAVQPFERYIVLTNTSEWKMQMSAGGGLRFTLSPHLQLRTEVLAQMTQSPEKVITPVTVASPGGWMFEIVPMVSLSYAW